MPLESIFQTEEGVENGVCVRFELHQEIGIAALRVEVDGARGRAEHLQPTDFVASAEMGDFGALLIDERMHLRCGAAAAAAADGWARTFTRW